jgi:hypothetical protein
MGCLLLEDIRVDPVMSRAVFSAPATGTATRTQVMRSAEQILRRLRGAHESSLGNRVAHPGVECASRSGQGVNAMSKESKRALNEAVEELEAAREAARLRLHLFSMDARRAIEGLEDKAKEFHALLVEEKERTSESSAEMARDLARAIRKFAEKHV